MTSDDALQRGGRRWMVPLVLIVGLVVAVTLIITGRSSDNARVAPVGSTSSTSEPRRGSPLRWLGTFSDETALRDGLRTLNPRTLLPLDGHATSTAPATATLTDRDAQRCAKGITMTSTDPLGSALASAAAALPAGPVLVTSYQVLAPSEPAQDGSLVPTPSTTPSSTPPTVIATRMFVVDAASCRVITAVNYPS